MRDRESIVAVRENAVISSSARDSLLSRTSEVPVRTRLFHTVILVGTAMGASLTTVSCGGSVSDSESDSGSDSSVDSKSHETFGGICDCGSRDDSFPGIGYRGDTGRADSWTGIADTGAWFEDTRSWDSIADTWPGIRPADSGIIDTGTDTFPGITPVSDTGTDTWPGISPPPDPDAHA